MGCFRGAERRFWETDAGYTTAVGYARGQTPNPPYDSGIYFHSRDQEQRAVEGIRRYQATRQREALAL